VVGAGIEVGAGVAARREAALPPEQRNPRSLRELFQLLRPFLAQASP